jgi:pectinesterase
MKTKLIIFSTILFTTLFSCKKAEMTAADTETEKGGDNTKVASAVVAYNITVAKDGSGNYTTLQAAINAVPNNSNNRTVIYIKNGTYKEAVTLETTKKNVTLIGQSAAGVKITYNNYASGVDPSTGQPWGYVYGSATFKVKAEGFYAVNVTFENNSYTMGQALAIGVVGDKAVFNNCRFLGRQDTFYGGSIRQYLKNCYLEGTTDFIYGSTTAVFESCKLYSYGGSAITAASTESYIPFGLVFLKCNISGADGVHTDLGRPWRPYAATAFLNTAMTSVVNARGWNNWGNTANETTARYSEYRNNGDGATITSRPTWIKRLTDAQAATYTVTNILKTTYTNPVTTDNWNPNTVINATGATVN